MQDNNLKISFDFRYPDEAALIVYSTFGGGYLGGDPQINIRKVIIGDGAVELYSKLTDKSVEDIRKEALKGSREHDQSLDQAMSELHFLSGLSLSNICIAFTHLLFVSLPIKRILLNAIFPNV